MKLLLHIPYSGCKRVLPIPTCTLLRQHRHSLRKHTPAVAAAPIATPLVTVLQQSIVANPAHFLLSLAAFVAGAALAAFLVAAIPSVLVRAGCARIQATTIPIRRCDAPPLPSSRLPRQWRQRSPTPQQLCAFPALSCQTASRRLPCSGVPACATQTPPKHSSHSNDLTQGVRASMRAVSTAEQGVRDGAALAAGLVSQSLIPAVKGQVPKAAGV